MARSGRWQCIVTMTDYRPVSCDLHSECELLALRQTHVWLTATLTGGLVRDLPCRVRDLCTRDGAEFLEVQTEAGESLVCRLDQLHALRLEDGRQISGEFD